MLLPLRDVAMPFERVSTRCWTAGTELRVLRLARPKYACEICNKVMQAAAPKPLIALGPVTPALLAQVLISNTPLYLQSQKLTRPVVDLSRSTLAGWVGSACRTPEALRK